MNSILKGMWVKALRSGKYEQGKGALCKKEKYCCLGVLADISGVPKIELGGGLIAFDEPGHGIQATTFGTSLGLEDKHLARLWRMNDGRGAETYSFNDIAQWIEDNV